MSPDPKPLALHMSLQALSLLSALSALPFWKNGSLVLKGHNQKSQNKKSEPPKNLDLNAFSEAVAREGVKRLNAFSLGIQNYQAHPRLSRPEEPPIIWSEGTARLLDYGVYSPKPSDRIVFVVPSLINRSYVLDITQDRSFMRFLAAKGFRPLLMDWGWPGEIEQKFGLDDYIDGHLQSALNTICEQSSKPPALVGYCMGGNLALALAQKNQPALSALALLATPWDFHSDGASSARLITMMAPALEALISTLNYLPVDMLQALFASLDPGQTAAKFRHFANQSSSSEMSQRFVALEDWVNDGVPLPGKVARECLFGWYRDNTTFNNRWQINNTVIDPAEISLPAFAAIPSNDHIVPPSSAMALADLLQNADIHTPNAGHIGMVAGGKAVEQLYKPLTAWLSKHFK
jgi:polyhydroxyalkanoate synthase